jgi:hypothetical protein
LQYEELLEKKVWRQNNSADSPVSLNEIVAIPDEELKDKNFYLDGNEEEEDRSYF